MSLPVWEEWIEIDGRRYPNRTNVGLFPYGKSGLKCFPVVRLVPQLGLFPYGKSGLKSPAGGADPATSRSLPVWEEWIEIPRRRPPCRDYPSLPIWEEWIEIPSTG